MIPCPTEDELVRFVDGALSLEDSGRLRSHVGGCRRCADYEATLRSLIVDAKAMFAPEIDTQAHTRAVMQRIDRPVARRAAPRRLWWLAGAGASVAAATAAVALVFAQGSLRVPFGAEEWRARGGHAPAAMGRDVGVQPYVVQGGLRPLVPGATIDAATPLTAGFRNLGEVPAFLLLFAVDARGVVHWISPKYVRAEDDPPSTPLPGSVGERLLDTTAVLEDVSAGPLRVVAVLTSAPAHVSDIESLANSDLTAGRVARRLRGAEVRETLVEVTAGDGAPR